MEALEGLTHFDSRFIRSVKLLVARPGVLTQYFSQGRQVDYMKPFPLFIICNILFFILTVSLNSFSITLSNFYQFKPYTHFGTVAAVNAKLAAGWTDDMLALIFNERMAAQSKAYILFFIPVLASVNSLLFIKKRRFFTEHLVFSLHFFCFILLYYIISRWLIEVPYHWITSGNYNHLFDMVSTLLGMAIFVIYFSIASSRYYRVFRWHSIAAGILIVVIYQAAIVAYRLLLFYKIMHSIH